MEFCSLGISVLDNLDLRRTSQGIMSRLTGRLQISQLSFNTKPFLTIYQFQMVFVHNLEYIKSRRPVNVLGIVKVQSYTEGKPVKNNRISATCLFS